MKPGRVNKLCYLHHFACEGRRHFFVRLPREWGGAAHPEAVQALALAANGKERVIATGHRITSPECIYFAVESVTRMVRD